MRFLKVTGIFSDKNPLTMKHVRFYSIIVPSIIWLNLCTLYLLQGQTKPLDPWTIEAENIDPNHYYGITVANGVIGLVSSADPLRVNDVVLNGVFDYYQRGRVSNILKTFNHANMALDINGMRVNNRNISNYRQSLDMKSAILLTEFEVDGKAIVKSQLMALRHLPYSSLQIIEIKALEDIEISPMSVMEAPVHLQDVRNHFNQIDRPHVLLSLLSSVARSPSGSISVAASNSFIFEEPHGKEPRLIHEDWDYNMHLLKFHKSLKKGEVYSFAVVGSTCSSVQYNDPYNEAERLTIYAVLEGRDRLLNRHKAEWANLWESDIEIEGSIKITRDVRSMLYHLYSFAREGTSYSISPMGLSGLGYNGHIFWDTEIWMFPPLLLLQPAIARSLLEYRFERLQAAKQNAFAHGYKGAMFPWESAADGSEDTPVWALTGPFQHHISACVAWAFYKYFEVTQDKDWLANKAWPVLKEVADFWSSRVERNGEGAYDINNVIGANEWAENIDNNAFTNGMAKTVLIYATEAAKILGKIPDPDWMHVANNIPILSFPDGTTKENSTYQGEIIKQADVNLLAYPLTIVSDEAQIKKDIDYYYPRFAPVGPAMGGAIISILYSQLGFVKEAEQSFLDSYQHNTVPPFGVLAETAGGANPYFATGAGGTLQAILAGFGGIRITEEGVTQLKSTHIPSDWKKLSIKGVGPERKSFVIYPK